MFAELASDRDLPFIKKLLLAGAGLVSLAPSPC
jgi:hypothetical protein